MHSEFMEALENSPVIAAVKDDDGLKKCLETDSSIVFILYGDICNIPQIVKTVCREDCHGACGSDPRTQPERDRH